MNWALEHLGSARCGEIARSLVPGLKPGANGLWWASCPFPGHADRNPSFSYDQTQARYKCWSHGDDFEGAGSIVDLWARLRGIHDEKQALKGFVAEYAPDQTRRDHAPAPKQQPRARPGQAKRPPAPPLPESELEALPPLPDSWITGLIEKRGWSREMIQALDLRLWRPPPWSNDDSPRVAIPVRDKDGVLRNIRLYRFGGAKKHKMISYWTGSKKEGNHISYGQPPRLWPVGEA